MTVSFSGLSASRRRQGAPGEGQKPRGSRLGGRLSSGGPPASGGLPLVIARQQRVEARQKEDLRQGFREARPIQGADELPPARSPPSEGAPAARASAPAGTRRRSGRRPGIRRGAVGKATAEHPAGRRFPPWEESPDSGGRPFRPPPDRCVPPRRGPGEDCPSRQRDDLSPPASCRRSGRRPSAPPGGRGRRKDVRHAVREACLPFPADDFVPARVSQGGGRASALRGENGTGPAPGKRRSAPRRVQLFARPSFPAPDRRAWRFWGYNRV